MELNFFDSNWLENVTFHVRPRCFSQFLTLGVSLDCETPLSPLSLCHNTVSYCHNLSVHHGDTQQRLKFMEVSRRSGREFGSSGHLKWWFSKGIAPKSPSGLGITVIWPESCSGPSSLTFGYFWDIVCLIIFERVFFVTT